MKSDLIMKIRIPKNRRYDFLLSAVMFDIEVLERSDVTPFPDGQETNNNINDKMED